MHSLPLLSLDRVSLRFADKQLFENFDLAVHPGERIGIIGRNGSGKSSLVRILLGQNSPDSGLRSSRRDLRIAFVPQEMVFDAATVEEIILQSLPEDKNPDVLSGRLVARLEELGMMLADPVAPSGAAEAKIHDEMEALSHQLEDVEALSQENIIEGALKFGNLEALKGRSPSQLSGGQRKRLQIVCALLQEPQLLIMDEPTNHLDVETVEWLEESILKVLESDRSILWGSRLEKSEDPAFVVVSHDRALLDTLVNQTIELERGFATAFEGGYESYVQQKAQVQLQSASTEARTANRMKRELEWLRQGAKARTTKQQARIQRAGKLNAKLNLLKKRNASFGGTELDFSTAAEGEMRLSKQDLIQFKGYSVERDYDQTHFVFFDELELTLKPGMRVAIVGPNGCGKSTFFHSTYQAYQQMDHSNPHIKFHENAGVSLFDQERTRLRGVDKVGDLIIPSGGEFVRFGGRSMHVASFMDSFQFKRADLDAPVSSFSGGERARLLLARTLLDESNVLLLDEPTNDLDLWTLRDLEDSLVEFSGAVVFTSHDRYFLRRVGTHFLTFLGREYRGEKVVTKWHLYADLEQALERSKESMMEIAAPPAAPKATLRGGAAKEAGAVGAKTKPMSFKVKHRLDQLEQEIPLLENEREALTRILDGLYEANGSYEKTAPIAQEIAQLSVKIDGAYLELDGIFSSHSETPR